MPSLLMKSALSGLFALAAGAASAGVTVKYVESDKFVDLPYDTAERKQVLRELTSHFGKLDTRLAQGQELVIEVTDIDLAGGQYPQTKHGDEMRVMRGVGDAPSMNLRFALVDNGQVIRAGNSRLADTNYLQRVGRFANSDPLRTEKKMIDDWFSVDVIPKPGRDI